MHVIIRTYGFISGAIFIAFMVYIGFNHDQINFADGFLLNIGIKILGFSMIFFGVKHYRDKYFGGYIGFAKALQVAVLIAVISGTCYVASWVVVNYNTNHHFAEEYANKAITDLKVSGASASQINELTEEMEAFKERNKKPLYLIFYTYLELLPFMLPISIISALICKRDYKNE